MAIGDESSSSSTVSLIGTSEDAQPFNSVHDNPNLKITSQLLDGYSDFGDVLCETSAPSEELSHYDSFIEWPTSTPSEKVPPPTAAEIYTKIVEKTRVFQFLAGLNPDFEYARVHLFDTTHFPTIEEAHILSLRSNSSVTYASYLRDLFRDFCYDCLLCLSGTTVGSFADFTYIIT
ncbi:hypothetical protein GIB67_020141 [Kingdonia uniflora]|uniref:Uncharacterized protein n=1 Tax=Kingdonia uniflora TaxID=39325 RepID=A0A7J7NIW3_9MAGN|nr:hypothetical protein GIB67_020141 [Kingdonia uniflora]